MFRFYTADLTCNFSKVLPQDISDKLNAMTAGEIAIITHRITNSRVNLDGCNKCQMLHTIKAWLFKEPEKATEIESYIITRQDESKFIIGKVYRGDLNKRNYTIISRTAKTVMVIRDNDPYENKPSRCKILKQQDTEYFIYGREIIYSFNENEDANPILIEETKQEAKIKFEIGRTYISTTYYYSDYDNSERHEYCTVISRTDKTVTFATISSLSPENITIDANTGKRIYNNDYEKPARRNIRIDNDGIERAELDELYHFSADKYEEAEEKKDAFIEGYGEVITVEAKELQEQAEITATAEITEIKAIAAKTERNTTTPAPATFQPGHWYKNNNNLYCFIVAKTDKNIAYLDKFGNSYYCRRLAKDCNIEIFCSLNNTANPFDYPNSAVRADQEVTPNHDTIEAEKKRHFSNNAISNLIQDFTKYVELCRRGEAKMYHKNVDEMPALVIETCITQKTTQDERETPTFEDEYYSDFAGDNSHPEQDIPEEREPDSVQSTKKTEAWQFDKYAKDWTHEQFIKGVALVDEIIRHQEYKRINHNSVTEFNFTYSDYLRKNFSLKNLEHLAHFFNLTVQYPKHWENDTAEEIEKSNKYYLARIIAYEIDRIESVFIRTYATLNPPTLPEGITEDILTVKQLRANLDFNRTHKHVTITKDLAETAHKILINSLRSGAETHKEYRVRPISPERERIAKDTEESAIKWRSECTRNDYCAYLFNYLMRALKIKQVQKLAHDLLFDFGKEIHKTELCQVLAIEIDCINKKIFYIPAETAEKFYINPVKIPEVKSAQKEQKPETKPVKTPEQVTPKPRKISKTNKDSQVIQDIIRDLDALPPEEILNDTSKLDFICEDLEAELSGMKKAQILEFAAQRKICLRSLKKNAPIKTFAAYICKKIAMFKTIEAKQATAHKVNKPVEPQISPVINTSEQSKSVNYRPSNRRSFRRSKLHV